jgi:hypothetical protein
MLELGCGWLRKMVLGAVAAAMVTSSCGQSAQGSRKQVAQKQDAVVPLKLKVRLKGAANAQYDGLVNVRIVTLARQSSDLGGVLALGPVHPIMSSAGPLEVTLDLTGYDHDGRFHISPTDAKGVPKSATSHDLSIATVHFFAAKNSPNSGALYRYNSTGCTVRVEHHSRQGVLSCGHIEDGEGRALALDMRWSQ